MMQAGFIYIVTNKVNGKQYVGLTRKAVARRWSEHKTCAVIGKKTYLYSAIRKYGPDAFDVITYASVLNIEDLSCVERQIIQQLNPAYNQTNGGEFTFGRKLDAATKERIRQGSLGKKRTPEQKEAQRRISKERWDANPEFRAKCLEALEKGRANVDREKQRKATGDAARGRIWSAESRDKLSASCMGRVYGPEIIAKMAATKRKAVKCNETGEVFSCREEAAKKTGCSKKTIWRDCVGQSPNPGNRITFSYI
jgi:group I intron endonuclease